MPKTHKGPPKLQNAYSGIASLRAPKKTTVKKNRMNDPVSRYQNMQNQWQKQKLKQKQKAAMKNV